MIFVTYEELVKLVWLIFRLVIVVRIISGLIISISSIPNLIMSINESKISKEKWKIEKEKMIKITNINDEGQYIESNYKSTSIGFATTKPICDEKKSS